MSDTKKILDNIIEDLVEAGIDTGLLTIALPTDFKLRVSGDISNFEEKAKLLKILSDYVDMENIEIALNVLEEDDLNNLEENADSELLDEDHEYMGTQDLFKALEDGLPYVPPNSSSYKSRQDKSHKHKKGYFWEDN